MTPGACRRVKSLRDSYTLEPFRDTRPGACAVILRRVPGDGYAFEELCALAGFGESADGASLFAPFVRVEGNDDFAREVMLSDEGVHRHRKSSPPDGVAYENRIVGGEIPDVAEYRGARTVIQFFFSEVAGRFVIRRVLLRGLHFEERPLGLFRDHFREYRRIAFLDGAHAVIFACAGEVDDERPVPRRGFGRGRGDRRCRRKRRCKKESR